MDRQRALEIIAAYGSDPSRWPEADRSALIALSLGDDGLRDAIRREAALDRALGDWVAGLSLPPSAGAAERAAEVALSHSSSLGAQFRLAHPGRRGIRGRLALGGAVAAALIAAVASLGSLTETPATVRTAAIEQQSVVPELPAPTEVATAESLEGDQIWSTFFTPTPDEEELLI